MSTNYYTTDKDGEQLHIGKKSRGWDFRFRGYIKSESIPDLTSWSEWKIYLSDKEIKNEYDEVVQLEDFTIVVEHRVDRTIVDYLKLTGGYCRADYPDWVDSEKYSFSGYEFS